MNVKHPERRTKSDRLGYIVSRMRVRQDITPARLAEELAVSQRTVYRDLRSLERGQALKKRYSRREGRYLVETELALPPITLTPAEAAAIYSAAANPALLETCSMASELRAGLRKLGLTLAQEDSESSETEASLPIAPFSLPDAMLYRPLIETIRRAQRTNRKISLRFWLDAEQQARSFTISPYGLESRENHWYLLGQCEELGGIRLFPLAHIRYSEVLTERFRLPRRFQAESAFADAWQTEAVTGQDTAIRVRFASSAAPHVVSSRGQQFANMETLPDGSLICTALLSRRSDLNWWILSFGSAAEVLSPPELREEFARVAQDMAKCYVPG